jgi:hypothetical protein
MLLTSPNGKPKLVTNQVTYPARICSAPGYEQLDIKRYARYRQIPRDVA